MRRYLDAYEVAAYLGISYDSALRHMSRAGAIKLGGLVRIDEDALATAEERCNFLRG